MTHVITSLCLRDNGCADVCPVECINPGTPAGMWPNYYIDPQTCIDCGACIPECPYAAIFPEEQVPSAFQAKGGEFLNRAGLNDRYEGIGHRGQKVVLETTRSLVPGEMLDLTESIRLNRDFYRQ
jgi:ferredoxin